MTSEQLRKAKALDAEIEITIDALGSFYYNIEEHRLRPSPEELFLSKEQLQTHKGLTGVLRTALLEYMNTLLKQLEEL